jgi:iron complex outermembrane receptor protein
MMLPIQNYKRVFFVLLILCFSLNELQAQDTSKIKGTIFSTETGKAVSQAEVILNPVKLGTVTDENGRFEFIGLKAGNYEIEVIHLGCRSYHEKIKLGKGEQKTLNISLEKNIQNISGVEITDQAFQWEPYQKQVVEQADIEKLPARDPGEFLRREPNVAGIRKGGGNIDPVVRGFKFSQLNVQTNTGQKIEGGCPNRMDPAVSHIDVNDISRIEIIKGPYALRYGPNFGAVLNLVTEKARPYEKFELHAKALVGFESNWNGNKQHVSINGGNRTVYFALTGNHMEYANYTAGNDETIPSSFTKYNYSAELGIAPAEKHKLLFSYKNSNGRDINFPALPMDERQDETQLMSANYHYLNPGGLLRTVDTKVYYSDVNHEMDNKWRPFSDTVVAVSAINAKNAGGRADFGLGNDTYRLHVGADYEDIYKDGQRVKTLIMQPNLPVKTEALWSNAKIQNLGIFAEYKRQQSQKLEWVLSGRLDMNKATSDPMAFKNMMGNDVYYNDTTDSDYTNFSISAGMTYKFAKLFSLDFALGRGVRSPDMTERFIILLPVGYDDYDYLGNPQLKPENNQQADLTLNFNHENLGQISLNGFYSWITDYITGIKLPPSQVMPQTAGVLGVKKFENIDNAYLYGFDFSWVSPSAKPYGGSLIAAYTAGRNPEAIKYIVEDGQVVGSEIVENDPLPEIPPFEANLRAHWYFFDNDLKPEIHLRLVAAQNRISEAYDEKITPGFFTAGINLSYKFNQYLTMAGGVSNIFDVAYYEHLNRRIIGTDAPLYEPGRIFYLNVMVSF